MPTGQQAEERGAADTYGLWLAYASCGGRHSHAALDAYLAGTAAWCALEAQILAAARDEEAMVGASRSSTSR